MTADFSEDLRTNPRGYKQYIEDICFISSIGDYTGLRVCCGWIVNPATMYPYVIYQTILRSIVWKIGDNFWVLKITICKSKLRRCALCEVRVLSRCASGKGDEVEID